MTAKFKVGERIKCVRAGSASYIMEGNVYTVAEVVQEGGEYYYKLEEITLAHSYIEARFESVSGFVSQAPEAPPMILSEDAKERKSTPITTGVLDYFPRALAAVAQCSKAGNDQHNPGQPLHWDKSKSTDHADCIARHLIDRDSIDTDGIAHAAKLAWRALALLEIKLSEEQHGKQ